MKQPRKITKSNERRVLKDRRVSKETNKPVVRSHTRGRVKIFPLPSAYLNASAKFASRLEWYSPYKSISFAFTCCDQLDSIYQCHKNFLLGRRQQTTVPGQHFQIRHPSCCGKQQSLLKDIFIDIFDDIYFSIVINNIFVFEKYIINKFGEKYDKIRS